MESWEIIKGFIVVVGVSAIATLPFWYWLLNQAWDEIRPFLFEKLFPQPETRFVISLFLGGFVVLVIAVLLYLSAVFASPDLLPQTPILITPSVPLSSYSPLAPTDCPVDVKMNKASSGSYLTVLLCEGLSYDLPPAVTAGGLFDYKIDPNQVFLVYAYVAKDSGEVLLHEIGNREMGWYVSENNNLKEKFGFAATSGKLTRLSIDFIENSDGVYYAMIRTNVGELPVLLKIQ